MKWFDATETTKDGEVEGERKTLIEWQLEEGEVEKWWCNGMGSQPLYEVKLELMDGDKVRSGFLSSRLVSFPLDESPD